MKIVVIGAMEKEIEFLLTKIGSYETIKYSRYTFFEGNLFGNDLIVTACGIGKVASGLLISALVNHYKNIDLIINVGVSGGLLDKVNIGEVVVANALKYADADVTIFNYQYGQIPNCPVSFPTIHDKIAKLNLNINYKIGSIISGDQFYHKFDEVNMLINTYFQNDNVLCIDMESAALAHSAWFYNVDYLAIRAISDVIGSKLQDVEYEDNLELACKNSNFFLLEVLENLKN